MSWLNFNDSLNNLKGQISNLAQSVLAEEEGSDSKGGNYEDLKNICLQQEREIENLRRINEELNQKHLKNADWDWMTGDESNGSEDLKERIRILKDENGDLLHQLEQLDLENQQNCAKIIHLKDKVQGDYDRLREEHEALKGSMARMEAQLQEYKSKVIVNDDFKEKYYQVLEKCKRLESNEGLTLNGYNQQELLRVLEEIEALKAEDAETFNEKFRLIKTLISRVKLDSTNTESPDLKAENERLQMRCTQLEQEKELERQDYQQKIIKALQEAITDHSATPQSELPEQLIELSNIFKSTSQERDRLSCVVKEKNDEIQKLIDSSDILNQELMQKTRIIREYENEMKEFEKNNELLIMELESYKSNALETISESNEDKVILLEEELEQANDRIKHLEKTPLEKFDATTQTNPISPQHSGDQDQYTDLLNRYDKLQIEYDFLKKDFESIKEDLKFANEEYLSLKSMAEAEEMNTRNFQQHLDTLNAINEKLQAEIQPLKDKIDYLFRENSNLAAINEENYAQIERLEVYKEKSVLEANRAAMLKDEVASLTEKLRDVKMTETSLKLQCDTLHKEISNLNGIKVGLEGTLIGAREELKVVKNDLSALEAECNELRAKLVDREEKCLALEKEIEELKNNQDQIDGLSSSLELKVQELTIENNRLVTELQILQGCNNGVRSENDKMRLEVVELKQNVENLTNQNNNLTYNFHKQEMLGETIEELDRENEILRTSLEEFKRSTDAIHEANNETTGLQEQLKENNNHLTDENMKLKIELEKFVALKQSMDAMIIENNNLRNELHALTAYKQTADELMDENTKLKNELEKLVTLKHSMDAMVAENNDLRNKLQTLAAYKQIADGLIDENMRLKSELEKFVTLKHSMDAMIIENNDLRHELQTLTAYKQTADELIDENMKLKNELSALEQKLQNMDVSIENGLKTELSSLAPLQRENADLKQDLQRTSDKLKDDSTTSEVNLVADENANLKNQLQTLLEELQQAADKHNQLQVAFEQVSKSRDEIYKALKEKHEENVAYHNEIQRLMQIITVETDKSKALELQLKSNEDIEKIVDENNFLKEKCDVLTQNLLKEQEKLQQLLSQPSEEELALKRKLNKLQEHLLELEERHTQELIQAEQHNAELQAKVNKIEEREKNNSTMYTSVNIRANQQVESLQNLLATVTGERDSLRKQLSDAEDNINKQTAALTNLQLVLEQFRKDKEKEVFKETERLRRQISVEKQAQENLKKEIAALKSQQEETKQGLLAASRLSDQLEQSKRSLTTLKEEASQLKSQLSKKEEELNTFKTQTNGKVDKTLVKNLVIGFVTTNSNKLNADQKQILKIISTVLDFSREDHDKLNLNKDSQSSWLNALLGPQTTTGQNPQESLSKAFIQFLENESRPQVIPSLLHMNSDTRTGSATTSRSSSSTPKQNQPANLSEIVLPTFTDFGQSRNSSSILKDVLKDNS